MTVSPNASKVVYSVRTDNGDYDLRSLDLSVEPATDVTLTNDGRSREPSF